MNKLAAFAALFSPLKGPAWQAWQRGDFERAAELAREDKRAGSRMRVLLAHITGDYDLAVREYAKLSAIEKIPKPFLKRFLNRCCILAALAKRWKCLHHWPKFAPIARIICAPNSWPTSQ